jgi:hypothetical protein
MKILKSKSPRNKERLRLIVTVSNLFMNDSIERRPTTRPITPETFGEVFINQRGEVINAKTELTTDPEKGPVWVAWARQHLPIDVFTDFGMVGTEGAEQWANVVEHNIFVAASCLALGKKLLEDGALVNLDLLVRSAIVHDAAKRFDVESRGSRDAEPYDHLLATVLLNHGYSYAEIEAAKNTGRNADRFITDPQDRLEQIRLKGIEAAIIGYCDARIRGSRLYTLEESLQDNLGVKTDDKSMRFFCDKWYPYYRAVEKYLTELDPGLDPRFLDNDAVFATVQREVRPPSPAS